MHTRVICCGFEFSFTIFLKHSKSRDKWVVVITTEVMVAREGNVVVSSGTYR